MKQKQKIVVLLTLVLVAVLAWSYTWHNPSVNSEGPLVLEGLKILGEQNPQIHWQEMKRAQSAEYKSNGRNPFSPVKPPTPKEIQEDKDKQAKQAPPAPVVPVEPPKPTVAVLPANLKYFGYGAVPTGSPRRAFFVDGEDVYIVPEGETLLGRYKILKVGNTNLEFQEISTGLRGTAALEEPAPAPSA